MEEGELPEMGRLAEMQVTNDAQVRTNGPVFQPELVSNSTDNSSRESSSENPVLLSERINNGDLLMRRRDAHDALLRNAYRALFLETALVRGVDGFLYRAEGVVQNHQQEFRWSNFPLVPPCIDIDDPVLHNINIELGLVCDLPCVSCHVGRTYPGLMYQAKGENFRFNKEKRRYEHVLHTRRFSGAQCCHIHEYNFCYPLMHRTKFNACYGRLSTAIKRQLVPGIERTRAEALCANSHFPDSSSDVFFDIVSRSGCENLQVSLEDYEDLPPPEHIDPVMSDNLRLFQMILDNPVYKTCVSLLLAVKCFKKRDLIGAVAAISLVPNVVEYLALIGKEISHYVEELYAFFQTSSSDQFWESDELESEQAPVAYQASSTDPASSVHSFASTLPSDVKSSAVASKFITMVIGVIGAAAKLAPSSLDNFMIKYEKFFLSLELMKVGKMVFAFATELIACVCRCLKANDWSDFFVPQSAERSIVCFRSYLKRKDKMTDVSLVISQGTELLAPPHYYDVPCWNHYFREVEKAVVIAEHKAESLTHKKIPFVILLVGPPGTGKTTVAMSLAELCCAKYGDSVNAIMQYEPDNKYAQRHPVEPKVLFINDIVDDQSGTKTNTGVPCFKFARSVLDSTAALLQGAAVEDKNVEVRPNMLVITSNANAFVCDSDPKRMLRRLDAGVVAYQYFVNQKTGIELSSEETDKVPDSEKSTSVRFRICTTKTDGFVLSTVKTEMSYNLVDFFKYIDSRMDMHDGKQMVREDAFGANAARCACGLSMTVHGDKRLFLRCSDPKPASITLPDLQSGWGTFPEQWFECLPRMLRGFCLWLFCTIMSYIRPIDVFNAAISSEIERLRKNRAFMKTYETWVKLAPFVAVAGGLYVLYSKWSEPKVVNQSLFSKDKPVKDDSLRIGSVEDVTFVETTTTAGWKNLKQTVTKTLMTVGRLQGDQLVEKVQRQTHKLKIHFDGVARASHTHALWICRDIMILNHHALEIDKGYKSGSFELENGSVFNLNFSSGKMLSHDVVAFTVPTVIKALDISDYLLFDAPRVAFSGVFVRPGTINPIMVRPGNMEVLKVQSDVWFYNEPTQDGDCGVPIVALYATGPRIVGIHTLRFDQTAGAVTFHLVDDTILTKSVIREVSFQNCGKDFGSPSPKTPLRLLPESLNVEYVGTSNYRTTFKSDISLTHFSSFFSPLLHKQFAIPTKTHGMVGDEYKSSFVNNVLPSCGTFHLARPSFERAIDSMLADCLEVPTKCSPYSLKEVLTGPNSIPLNTSVGPGAPFGVRKKYDLFVEDPATGEFEFNEQIRLDVERIIQGAHAGYVELPNISGAYKDEVRPSEKVDNFDLRIFAVYPVAYNLVNAMFMKPIINYLLTRPWDLGLVGGINAASGDWERISTYLEEVSQPSSPSVIDMDQKKFDARHSYEMAFYVAEFFERLSLKMGYSVKERHILRVLVATCTTALWTLDGDTFIRHKGLPSGSVITLIFNSLVSVLLARASFDIIKSVAEVRSNERFKGLVRLVTVGDDILLSVDVRIRSWFNPLTIQAAYDMWGYEVTSGDKTALTKEFKSMVDVAFLKRTFRRHHELDCVVGPIEVDSIYKSLIFQGKVAISYEERLTAASENAQREAFLHGRDFFLMVQEKLREANKSVQNMIPYRELDYEALVRDYKEGRFVTWDM